jgi:hypothetical protein
MMELLLGPITVSKAPPPPNASDLLVFLAILLFFGRKDYQLGAVIDGRDV